MKKEDYPEIYKLWMSIQGFAIRSLDDSKEGIERFLQRNPKTSVVACEGKQIIGAILCGHDGRRGYFYHVCVAKEFRNHGIGRKMAEFALEALKQEGITKACLIAFQTNEVGNQFWNSAGWDLRDDLNYYDITLDEKNETRWNQ